MTIWFTLSIPLSSLSRGSSQTTTRYRAAIQQYACSVLAGNIVLRHDALLLQVFHVYPMYSLSASVPPVLTFCVCDNRFRSTLPIVQVKRCLHLVEPQVLLSVRIAHLLDSRDALLMRRAKLAHHSYFLFTPIHC